MLLLPTRAPFAVASLLVPLLWAGCQRQPETPPPPPPQKVLFVVPERTLVQESEEFPGRTAAVETITLRSRVTGYLDKIGFQDGAAVRAGDLLFEIDPRTYEAEEARTQAAIDQFQARVDRLERQQTRSQELFDKQAISQDQFETILYDLNEAKASWAAAIAAHRLAKLDVEFTRIVAPVNGRLSQRLVDPGNLVLANDTPLATLISLDQVYVYFDMDERTVLRLRRLQQEKSSTGGSESPVKIEIALADTEQFDLRGTIDFEDNQVDASTGTLRMRAVVDNRSGLLSPGLFVRVRYPIGQPASQLLIPEESLGSDQGRPFVYVIGDDDKVAYRSVEVGPQVGDRRVIHTGLEPGERVAVSGLQRIRRGAVVVPQLRETTSTEASEVITEQRPPSGGGGRDATAAAESKE